MLGSLLGGFIVIVIGANLMGPVATTIQRSYGLNSTGGTARPDLSSGGTTATILNLVPMFFALGIMASGVAITVNGLKNAGVM